MTRPFIIKEYKPKTDLVTYTTYLLGTIKKMNIDRGSVTKIVDDFNKDK